MIAEILGKDEAENIFYSSMITNLMMQKDAGFTDKLLGGLGTAATGVAKLPLWLAALGAGTGWLGSQAYSMLKERLAGEDPESDLNEKMKGIYKLGQKELEDSKWMADIRNKRDKLKRGAKKMTVDEYAKEYDELVEALNARRA